MASLNCTDPVLVSPQLQHWIPHGMERRGLRGEKLVCASSPQETGIRSYQPRLMVMQERLAPQASNAMVPAEIQGQASKLDFRS